jgi:hypothetical protein
MEFPLCKKLGVDVVPSRTLFPYVLASDLEALLASAKTFYGIVENGHTWRSSCYEDCKYTAKLILVEEIKPKVCLHERIRTEYGSAGPWMEITCLVCDKSLKPKGGWQVV